MSLTIKRYSNRKRVLFPGYIPTDLKDIYERTREGEELTANEPLGELFLEALFKEESCGGEGIRINYHKAGDIRLARRIIKAGGFVEYIKKLEGPKEC